MARIFFAIVVFAHGLIHLLGFVKEWRLARVDQLTGSTLLPLSAASGRVLGLAWLAACLIFAAAAAAFLAKRDWWWMAALAGVLLSQLLIIFYWKDAWAGTIPNAIILMVGVVAWAGWSFDRQARLDADTLIASAGHFQVLPEIVTTDATMKLPQPVARWLQHSGAVGSGRIAAVRLKQRGEMQTQPGGRWMPFEAEQLIRLDPPAFVWTTRVQVAPFIHLAGKDHFVDGEARMLMKLLSLVTVGDSRGAELNQGALVRYLAEISWCPPAALASYLSWEPVDDASARASMSMNGTTVSAVFTFTTDGDVSRVEARRFGKFGDTYRLETWSVSNRDYRVFGGIRIGHAADVTWKLASGDWTWLKLEITDLAFSR